ncbi:MAG: tRNA (adenosine(37)-N6)-threonylcarbamoyltransferase complex transferase subunit TsaD [Bacteroidetes bacterium]|nr:tRNA (adenosine(37)-N6)-threonylcarbamoyltransferase complex transferase subunit TsaD [Bacteroidota bacterium]MCB9226253.1 tRNA (adenosine(37)-N6)-threonylcarbamoyltransferase complex transferase subunit TsaD [Chitinophagales bacterium]
MNSTKAKNITLLAIESSCDDTSAAVVQNGKVLANVIASQAIHTEWGGVVPELASRAHQENIVPVVDSALKKANVKKEEITAIAFTGGPGLLGSLLVGVSFAKSMAFALGVPCVAVHHMKAHVLAHFIDEPKPQFPFLCLTVSGGHTQIVLVKDYTNMEVIGSTIDDAAGEAFDKCAKMFGLTYPGGPLIDKYAQRGNGKAFKFTEPRVGAYNFSFSGLKTAVLYFIEKQQKENPDFVSDNLNDLCASLQYTIVSILMKKLLKAAKDLGINQLAIAGGVSANSLLRKTLKEQEKHGYTTFIPDFQYCVDNAGMIAISGYYQYLANDFVGLDFEPKARWEM